MLKILMSLLLLLPTFLFASKKTYVTQKTNVEIFVDGQLNEAVWQNANWGSDFAMFYPSDEQSPTYQTKFAMVYDANFVYVAIKAFDSNPKKIGRHLTRRDDIDGDYLSINIDSYHDLQTSYEFRVSAAGTKRDRYFYNDGDDGDSSWDAIWWAKAVIVDDGWVVEMKIPFSQLRFVNKPVQTWGIQVRRYIQQFDEVSIWQPIKRNSPGWTHHFGLVEGIVDIKPKKVFDLTPYTVGRMEVYEKEADNPFRDGLDFGGNVGLDGKIGLTNNLTLDFTINPDFGQVEADPSTVNLSGFELFFREQRPFFVEGSNIMNFSINNMNGGSENLFYSRRVGRDPNYSPDLEDDEFSKQPSFTRIIGAAKITGRSNKGLSIGIVESVTAKEQAKIEDIDGNTRTENVEPLTNYAAISVQQDINKGNTVIGGMLTSVNRIIEDSHLEELRNNAYSGGVNFTQRWNSKKYYFSSKFNFSYVEGSVESILNTQESSVHLFQRTDATHINIDSSRTSLSGTGANISIGKDAGGRLSYRGSLLFKSPGLELNDIGYLRHADELVQIAWLGYRVSKPFSIFKTLRLSLDQWSSADFAGNFIGLGGNFNLSTDFTNNYHFEMGFEAKSKEHSTSYLRGGPNYITLSEFGGWFWAGSDPRKMVRIFANIYYGLSPNKYFTSANFKTGITLKPADFIKFELRLGYNPRYNEQQYITYNDSINFDRYILGTINQNIYDLSLRINCNITSDISIQYWGQPFVATGKYSDFKYVTDASNSDYNKRFTLYNHEGLNPQLSYNNEDGVYTIDEDSDGLNDYSFDNPDFNTKVFLSNMVFRWEYMPGSTLYFVWSQNRENYDLNTGATLSDNIRNTFNFKAQNTFLLKLSYRLGL